MLWRETLRGVFESFRANRLRFALTLSGVVVGAGSLVLLAGLLEGGKDALMSASRDAQERDLVEIEREDPPEKQMRKTTRQLDRGDVSTLGESPLLHDARVVGQRQERQLATFGRKRLEVGLVGTRGDALQLYRLELGQGRFFTADEVKERRRVAVVGNTVWKELFESAPSLEGLEIKVKGLRLVVVGVLAHKSTLGGGDGPRQWDGRVLVPQTTFDAGLPGIGAERGTVRRIFVRMAEAGPAAAPIHLVRNVIKATLLRRHYGVKNFEIEGEQDDDAADDLILGIISMLVLATAIISLLVGGINVMNIMLVSVTERTREIGIRRAVGAPRKQILWQFLAESTLTAGLGGVIGVVGGVTLTWVATVVLDKLTGHWTFHLVPWAPAVALGTAMFVGAAFGVYPAWRASRLDPVEALRFE